MLMHAAVLDDHHIAGLPGNMPAVMDVMAAALDHVEHRAVEMPVLLPVSARRVDLDMRLDRLRHVGVRRADDVLAVELRAALPWTFARRIDARLLHQRLVEIAIAARELAHEDALLRPALPLLRTGQGFVMRGLVVAGAGRGGGLVVKACHYRLLPRALCVLWPAI